MTKYQVLFVFILFYVLKTSKAGILPNYKLSNGKNDYPSSTLPSIESCDYNGEYYNHGELFMDDCNWCRCADQQVTCTLMLCPTTVSN
ncbi:hypothetical protein I4U23_003714 [Adineta vaga]|nr:hypothetical protein I4U23_003714 [Adineta vaga]